MLTKVQKSCITMLVKKDKIEAAVLIAIEANLEGNTIFLDRAEASAIYCGMTKHQFAGGLSALAKKGIYIPSCDPEYAGLVGTYKVKNPE